MRRYRAFISYSHKDRAAGDRLFQRIDGYRPPKALRNRQTPCGPVPARLYPVFRDREELATTPDLPARLEHALAASDHLVVLCSPDAAASRWVNEEIATFRRLGKAERIHAVITAGDPPAAFPPELTRDGEKPLAADLRPSGDGWTDGPLKVIAGLLGIGFGELKDREVARARARSRLYGAIALAFAILAVVAGISAWRAVEQTKVAEAQLGRAEAAILTAVVGIARIVDQVVAGFERGSIPTALARSLLTTADGLIRGVIGLAPDNPRLLLEQGKVLLFFAVHFRTAGDLQSAKAAAKQAQDVFAALEAWPGSAPVASMMRGSALSFSGELLLAAGDRTAAVDAFQQSLAIFQRLAASDLGNTDVARTVQGAVSASLEGLGTARRAAGDRTGALAVYEESLEINRRMTASDPDDPRWASMLAIGLTTVGTARMEAGDRYGALKAFHESLTITRSLAASGDPERAYELAAVLRLVGDVHRAEDDRPAALAAYEESLTIARRLAATDRDNKKWARGLAVSLIKVGDMRAQQGDHGRAIEAFQESLAITRDLAAADPADVDLARDVTIGLERIGDALMAMADHAAARVAFTENLAIRRRLATTDPGNTTLARDLSVILNRIGDVLLAEGDRAAALEAYAESLDIRERLAAADPGNAVSATDVIFSRMKVGEATNERAASHRLFATALAQAEALAASGRLSPVDAWMVDELRSRLAAGD